MDHMLLIELVLIMLKITDINNHSPVTTNVIIKKSLLFSDASIPDCEHVFREVKLKPELQVEQIEGEEEQVLQDSIAQFSTFTNMSFWVVVPEIAELM